LLKRRASAASPAHLIKVPIDGSDLHYATLLPAYRKLPLTPVPYADTVDIGAGAWSIRGLSSTLLNKIPASGGQSFHAPAEGLYSPVAKKFGDL
jgi:hypothetical protein